MKKKRIIVGKQKKVPTDNLPFPSPPKQKVKQVPANQHLVALTEKLQQTYPSLLEEKAKESRNFIINEAAAAIVGGIMAVDDAKEVLSILLRQNIQLDIQAPFLDLLSDAAGLKMVDHVAKSMQLTESQRKMLYYIQLSKAIGSKELPSESVLLELLKGLAVP